MSEMNDISCAGIEDLMCDALFDPVDPASFEVLQRHLAACSSCATAFAELQQTLELVAAGPVPEMPQSYWETYYDRLMNRMRASAAPSRSGILWRNVREVLVARLAGLPTRGVQAGFALALVLIGVLIGRTWQPASRAVESSNFAEAQMLPAALSARAERYLDRSSVLLLGLVNVDVSQGDRHLLKLDRKQKLAGELVREAGALKADLERMQEQQLAHLVEDLEKILLQIANLEMQQDIPSIELIQRGVDRGDLLLKINLEKMKMGERNESRVMSHGS